MKRILLGLMLPIVWSSRALAADVACDPRSPAVLKMVLLRERVSEFGVQDERDLRVLCRDGKLIDVVVSGAPGDWKLDGVIRKGTAANYATFIAAMQTAKVGTLEDCRLVQAPLERYTAQIRWMGRNGRSNYFVVFPDEETSVPRCSEEAAAFARIALFLQSLPVDSATSFP